MADWITDREPEEGVAVLAWLDGELFIAMLAREQWNNIYDCMDCWCDDSWHYDWEGAIPLDGVQTWAWQPLPQPPTQEDFNG